MPIGPATALQLGTAPLQGFGFGIGYGSGVRVGFEQVYPRIANQSSDALDFVLSLLPGFNTASGRDAQIGQVDQNAPSPNEVAISNAGFFGRSRGHNPRRARQLRSINSSGATVQESGSGKYLRLIE